MVPIGPRALHVVMSGRGTPVVLEAGAGEWSSHWELVRTALEGRIASIAYDRAGLGWSPPAAGSRAAPVLASEMLQLLDSLGVAEPVILVAHSFGASIARLAAHGAPHRVRGIVFVDGWHESFEAWEAQHADAPSGPMARLAGLLEWSGAVRGVNWVLNRLFPPASPWPVACETWQAMLAISSSRRFQEAAMAEVSDSAQLAEAGAPGGRLEVPVIALVAKETLSPGMATRGQDVDGHNRAWRAASAQLASLAERSEVRFITRTDHMIPLMRPDVVVDAITAIRQLAT
jgi:pimeloyl-ACP methyl ester carboxylesterase